MAERVQWEVAAKIYQWFDEELEKLKPEIEASNKEQFMKLASMQWVKHGHPAENLPKSFPPNPEMDEVVRLFTAMDVKVTDEMLDLLDDDAKHWLINHPLQRPLSEDEQAELERYGDEFDIEESMQKVVRAVEMLEDAYKADDKDLVSIASGAVKAELMRPQNRLHYQKHTKKQQELVEVLKTKSGKASSTISAVGKRYIKERKWNREKTRSGARIAIVRFCNLIGNKTDISDITAKHAYSFATWMEDELDAANRSIKSSCSYVKGMFAWAITQQDYQITRLPWDKLDKISDYGVPSKGYKPFTIEQLHEIFSLVTVDGIGKMNPREHLLLAILITTGCRMDEAALLCWDNIIKHDKGFHYIDLTKALVKNMGSKRLLPIPDVLINIMPQSGHQVTVDGIRNSPDGRLFDYSLDTDGKSSRAASQACKRQLEKIKREKMQVTHSFRGNLKDMLRDAGVSKELNNYITGHAQGDVGGDRYGEGHSVELRYKALNKLSHPYIQPYES
jgi:integrase